MKSINDLPKNVSERLEYLEFMLRFRGWTSRNDLTERFGIGDTAATRDIRQYRDFAEKNLTLNQKTKKYEKNELGFEPLFELPIKAALSKIRNEKICEALGMADFEGILSPPRLSYPCVEILSSITRAIALSAQLVVTYGSIESGRTEKSLIPHSLFDNGIHWYMRAYDVNKEEFRSYALTRIINVQIDRSTTKRPEFKNKDFQWNRMVPLELVPHPNRKNVRTPEAIEHDFNMKDGCLKVMVRATVAGYWLQQWGVDCTEDHSLKEYRYQLWLRNHQILYDVESRVIAPGLSNYHKVKPIKIVLNSFGHPAEPDKEINNSFLSETIEANSRFSSHEIYKLPEVGELFMVVDHSNSNAFSDKVFECITIKGEQGFDKIEGFECIIIASFKRRLTYIEDESERTALFEYIGK